MGFFIQLIVGLILMIVGYLLMPRPKQQKPEQATDMEGPTAEAGRPIAVIFGDITVKSPNFLWWGDKETRQRKQKQKKK